MPANSNDKLKFRSGNDNLEGPKVYVFILVLVKYLTPIIIAVFVFVERKELMKCGAELFKAIAHRSSG